MLQPISLFMVEQSSTRSPFIRTCLKISRFIGIYLLSGFIVYFLGRQNLLANIDLNPVLLLIGFFIALPLVWALSKNFLAGFMRYALLLGLIILISKVLPENNPTSSSESSTQDPINYIGTYSTDENGVQIKLIAGPNKWYSEIIEGITGQLISSAGGEISNNLLYDEYGNEIGEFGRRDLKITIQGQLVRLKKE